MTGKAGACRWWQSPHDREPIRRCGVPDQAMNTTMSGQLRAESADEASREPPRDLDRSRCAFFFDLDGTLAAIAPEPGAVRIEERVIDALAQLNTAAGGAVAIVSGRAVRQVDALVSPLRLPVAGVHGLERRDLAGALHRVRVDQELADRVGAEVGALAAANPGLLREVKPGSVALHYRKRPELADTCLALARRLAAGDPRIHLLTGRMVVELKFASLTKGDAIAAFMAESPFAGRVPLFVGDDVTDEDGFAEVMRRGGIAIRIGDGATAANWRLRDIGAFHRWLAGIAGTGGPEAAGDGR